MICTVTATFRYVGGAAATGVIVRLQPRDFAIRATAVALPTAVSAITNASGQISLALAPGEYTMIVAGLTRTIKVPMTSTALLGEIIL